MRPIDAPGGKEIKYMEGTFKRRTKIIKLPFLSVIFMIGSLIPVLIFADHFRSAF